MKKIKLTSMLLLSTLLLVGCNTTKKETVKHGATSSEIDASLTQTLKAETSVYVAAIRGNGYTTKEMAQVEKKTKSTFKNLNSDLKKYKKSKKIESLTEYNNDVQKLASAVLDNKSDKDIYNSITKANKQSYQLTKKKGFHVSKSIASDFYSSQRMYGKIYSKGSQKIITYPSRKTFNLSDSVTIHTLAAKYVYANSKDTSWNGADTEIDGVSIMRTKPFTYTDNNNDQQKGNGVIMVNVTVKANKDIFFYPDNGKLITNDGQQLDASTVSDSFGQIYSGAKKSGSVFFYVPNLKNINSITKARFVFDSHAKDNVLNSKNYSFNIKTVD